MLAKKKVAIYLAAVFLTGLLAGGIAGFSMGLRKAFSPPKPQDMVRHICDRLKTKLHLSSVQLKEIEPLVTNTAAELEAVHSNSTEQISEIFQKSNQRLAQFLTPDQKLSLDAMERERQRFFRKTFRTQTGPPPSQTASPPVSR